MSKPNEKVVNENTIGDIIPTQKKKELYANAASPKSSGKPSQPKVHSCEKPSPNVKSTGDESGCDSIALSSSEMNLLKNYRRLGNLPAIRLANKIISSKKLKSVIAVLSIATIAIRVYERVTNVY
jgi:hypothetical protein